MISDIQAQHIVKTILETTGEQLTPAQVCEKTDMEDYNVGHALAALYNSGQVKMGRVVGTYTTYAFWV